ncbi:hypothetical protein ACIRPZ_34860 [Streptomyces anulatus]
MSAELGGFVRLDHYLAAPPRNGYSPVESADWTGVQMLGLGCLTPDGFEPRQLKNAPGYVSEDHSSILIDGDILMSRANTRDLVGLVGRYRDVGTPCIYPDLMMRLRVKANCLPEFLELILRSSSVRQNIQSLAQGTSESMVKISAGAVSALPVPDFPLVEQRRIVEILDSISESEKVSEHSIAKLRIARRSLVEEQLATSRSHVAFSEYALSIQSGWSPSCDQQPPGPAEWGVVRVSAVTQGVFRPEESKRLPPSLDPRENLEIIPGDLLMARANGAKGLVGVTCLVGETRERLMLSDKILRITPGASCAGGDFLHILLGASVVRSQIDALLSGSTGQANISQAAVMSLRVPEISVAQQAEVVATSAAFDASIRMEEEGLAKLRQVKYAVTSQLLGR